MTAASADALNLLAHPGSEDFVHFPASFGTRFMLVVDTEEEFDWNAPFDRESRRVSAMDGMRRAQSYFEAADVKPLYVTDYPVIDHPEAGAMLAQWMRNGRADVGAHLHPWVNPPHVEEVNRRNSYAGNLPEALERAKLTVLRDRIAEVTGRAPLAFRAGRYGVGPCTGAILRDLGFRVDTSIRSRFDYSAQHGPDFSGRALRPYWLGADQELLELPLSTAWAGGLRRLGDRLLPIVEKGGAASGLLARSGLLQRIPLTPEGVTVAEARRAIDQLLADGLPLLMFSFHSPTVAPGNTPYVQSERDLDDFYRWWDGVLEHLTSRGVAPATLDDVRGAAAAGN